MSPRPQTDADWSVVPTRVVPVYMPVAVPYATSNPPEKSTVELATFHVTLRAPFASTA